MIEIKNLSRKFDYTVLDQINLTFEEGKIYVLKGISGCGKTTLLNIISGIDLGYEGELFIDDIERKAMNKEQDLLYRNSLGYMMQKSLLFSHMKVDENLTFIDNQINKVKMYADKFGVSKLLKKKPNELSGGEKQRVSLIRALLSNNKIIIADEPTSSLDEENALAFVEHLTSINVKDKIIIIASHKTIYDKLADEIIELELGKVKEIHKNENVKVEENVEENVRERILSDDKTFFLKNRKKSSKLISLFMIVLFTFLLVTLSFKLNIHEAYIQKSINNNKYQMIDINSSQLDEYKDIIEETFGNYTLQEPFYKMYSLLDEEDSHLSLEKNLLAGKFPETPREVLVNEEFLSMEYSGMKLDKIIGKKIKIKDKPFTISGIVGCKDKKDKQFLYQENIYYKEIKLDENSNRSAVFVPYVTMKKLGEKENGDSVLVKLKDDEILGLYMKRSHVNVLNLEVFSNTYGERLYYDQRVITDFNFYANAGVLCFIVFGILSMMFISNQINLELFYRKKEIGYLQLFHLTKLEIGFVFTCQYLFNIVFLFVLSSGVYGLVMYEIYQYTGLNLMLSIPLLLIALLFIICYCIIIVCLPLRKILKKDVMTLIRE